MVIASALAYIRDTEAIKRNTRPENVLGITAIHIDYANRPESRAEASYVERYSNRLGAKFVCRRIDEVTRGVTARDDYERIAREIRFDLYRQCSSEVANGCGYTANEGNVGVMLGHHRGDLRENVLSNAHKGAGPLDLSGMTSVSKNDGVTLFRPLLPLEKVCAWQC
jgi:tRNA(Ile)-lysidine synthase TilS/MesJ